MAYRDHMIERFPCGPGLVGYDRSGRILVDGDASIGDFPILDAIRSAQDPTLVTIAFEQAREARLKTPLEVGANAAGLTLDTNEVCATLDLPEDSYEQHMTLDEFEPILRAWEKAWQAAEAYRHEHRPDV